MKRRALTIYTVGHSARTLDEPIAILRAHGIKRLVDVRTSPRSRHNPQFNRETLSKVLRNWHLAYTGLRASELAGLTPKSFKLDADPPGITVRALTTKNRENVHQPVPPELVRLLKQWLKDRDPDERLWPGGWNRRAAEMLRVDLEAADIPFETDDGVFDFHCLRVSYVTNLVKSGANPKIVQTLARHSTIVLTMDLYAKQDAKEAADALKKLPPIRRRRCRRD